MLQMPEKLVRSGQARILGGGDEFFVIEPNQRQHGSTVPDPRFTSAMQPLQALDKELDISNPPASQLDIDAAIHSAAPGHKLLVDTLPGRGDRLNRGKVERGRVDFRLGTFEQLTPGLTLTCGYTGLDQHLELPVAGPLRVVGTGTVQRDADLSVPPVGPQPQIDAIAH